MSNLVVNEEMLKIKNDLNLLNIEIQTNLTSIEMDLDNLANNWKGKKATIFLEPIDGIKTFNKEIVKRITTKEEEIGKAYDIYLRNSETEITQSSASTVLQGVTPSPTVTPSPVSATSSTDAPPPTVTPSPTSAPSSTDAPSTTVTPPPIVQPGSTMLGSLITPNTNGLKFSYDNNGNIKRQGNTDFYPVKSNDGTSYLLYLGGRSPNEPIPSNMQIVLGLGGSGELATGSGSELNKLFNNGVAKHYTNPQNKQEVIAIVPQIVKGKSYDDLTLKSIHNIYSDVKNAYGANDKMDMSGISMGGQTIIRYAAHYPNDVSNLTVISGAPMLNHGKFNFTEDQLQNLKSTNILFVSGKKDWKNGQYDRALQYYGKLTGRNSVDYSVSKESSLLEIAKTHKSNGGISFVEVYDAGHNTWDFATPAVLGKI